MLKPLKNKSGFTLIELIVGMMIFAILATSASVVLSSLLRLYMRANELAECGALMDDIANQMTSDISSASSALTIDNTVPEISFLASSASATVYSVDGEGALLRNGEQVFSKVYYKGKSVGFSCEEDTTNGIAYILTIVILSDSGGTEIMRREYAVRPLILNPYPRP